MRRLGELSVGECAMVIRLHGQGAVRRRLMDMGITRGTSVSVRKKAPLGDPMEITVRGYELTLRRCDADIIEISPKS